MTDPISTSIILGISGNLATNIVESHAANLRDTKLGKYLSKAGLIKPGFSSRISQSVGEATTAYIEKNPSYNISEVHAFLGSKTLSRALAGLILNMKPVDVPMLAERMSHYIGVAVKEAPYGWPNHIDPFAFIYGFIEELTAVFGSHADEGLIWLSTSLAEHNKHLAKIQLGVDEINLKVGGIAEGLSGPDGKEVSEFEAIYLSHLNKRFQKVTTPGARELHGVTQSLSIAYISLNLKANASVDALRAEDFLSKNPVVVVRGPAGSGKTTLLSWIITQCAKPQEEPSSKTGWEGLIPFFVPLRKVARIEAGAPSVDRLIEYSVDENVWTRPTPPAWLDRVLRGQRAVIMIDGVDELPASRRSGFWTWLQAMIAEFPGNRVIVTSRALPGSPIEGQTTDQWNPPSLMIEAQLQDMSNADVTQFIHHWHDAVDNSKLDQSEKNSLTDARQKLPQKLEDPANRRIRELCNTPLLCAMVCVLHWREEGYLPRYRVDLYDKCCDMLIEARDLKREISAPPGPIAAMSKNDKEMVLQRLAIEMMHNRQDGDSTLEETYRIEISRDKAVRWISPKIAGFQSTLAREAKPSEVLDFLVERTGLLREPAKDLIDFPHRTFQEYLAACAAGADSQEDMLAKKADDDQWHETIMLAAGTTTGGVGFGRNLIEALLDRGERHKSPRKRQQAIRKTCFALALGCLENLKQHDTQLRDRVLANLGELVPPRNEVDAGILSVAGDAAVSHLSYAKFKDEDTTTVAACARALRLIGTTEAMKALERGYLTDQRETVIAEVCRTDYFDYASIPVVAHHVARSGRLPHFAPSENIQLCVNLEGLKHLSVDWPDARNRDYLSKVTQLDTLIIDRVSGDHPDLQNLSSNIESLSIVRPVTGMFPWVERLGKLRHFSISRQMENVDLSFLSKLPELSSMTMSLVTFATIEAIPNIPTLEKISVNGVHGGLNLDFIKSFSALRSVAIEDVEIPDFTAIGKLDNLEDLTIMGVEEMGFSPKFNADSKLKNLYYSNISGAISVADFSGADDLENLGIVSCRNIGQFEELNKIVNLRSLQLGNLQIDSCVDFSFFTKLDSLRLGMLPQLRSEWLSKLSSNLTNLVIQRCPNISDLNFLANCDQINSLSLAGIQGASDMAPVRELTAMSTLNLENCDNIEDLSWISRLPIEELSLISMDGIKDFSPIGELGSLKTIAFFDCDYLNDLSFLADLPLLEKVWIFTQQDKLHVPESVSPRVVRAEPYSAQWRTFNSDWAEDIWMYEETPQHIYRRIHRPSYYYWHQRQLRLAETKAAMGNNNVGLLEKD